MTRIKRAEAKRICLEMWDWCRQTGQYKREWPELRRYQDMYLDLVTCPYCAYAKGNCDRCPITKKLGFFCEDPRCYYTWWTRSSGNAEKKKNADLFYQQLLKT